MDVAVLRKARARCRPGRDRAVRLAPQQVVLAVAIDVAVAAICHSVPTGSRTQPPCAKPPAAAFHTPIAPVLLRHRISERSSPVKSPGWPSRAATPGATLCAAFTTTIRPLKSSWSIRLCRRPGSACCHPGVGEARRVRVGDRDPLAADRSVIRSPAKSARVPWNVSRLSPPVGVSWPPRPRMRLSPLLPLMILSGALPWPPSRPDRHSGFPSGLIADS